MVWQVEDGFPMRCRRGQFGAVVALRICFGNMARDAARLDSLGSAPDRVGGGWHDDVLGLGVRSTRACHVAEMMRRLYARTT